MPRGKESNIVTADKPPCSLCKVHEKLGFKCCLSCGRPLKPRETFK